MWSQTCDDLVISHRLRTGGQRTLMAARRGDTAKRVASEGLVIGQRSETGWEETPKSCARHVIVIPGASVDPVKFEQAVIKKSDLPSL